MTLGKYIHELLFRYECVTVPDFGAFLTRSVGALIQYDTGVFTPPQKALTFNSLLKTNDGILAQYVAQKQNISYENALRLIEKEVGVWKQKLQTQPLFLNPVGELRLNTAKRVYFTAYTNNNYDPFAFGLSVFTRKPLQTVISNQTQQTHHVMEKDNDNLMFTPEEQKEAPKSNPVMRYAAIGIIAIALLGGGYYFGNQYLENERIKNQQLAQKRITATLEKATFNLGTLNSMSLNISAQPEATEAAMALEQPYYSVIAGTYRDINNAEKVLENLKMQGYEAAFTAVNPEGMHRVAYGRFTSKREAIKLLYFIKYTLKEDAWYLEEK